MAFGGMDATWALLADFFDYNTPEPVKPSPCSLIDLDSSLKTLSLENSHDQSLLPQRKKSNNTFGPLSNHIERKERNEATKSHGKKYTNIELKNEFNPQTSAHHYHSSKPNTFKFNKNHQRSTEQKSDYNHTKPNINIQGTHSQRNSYRGRSRGYDKSWDSSQQNQFKHNTKRYDNNHPHNNYRTDEKGSYDSAATSTYPKSRHFSNTYRNSAKGSNYPRTHPTEDLEKGLYQSDSEEGLLDNKYPKPERYLDGDKEFLKKYSPRARKQESYWH